VDETIYFQQAIWPLWASTGSITRPAAGENWIFWDKVFKTILISDQGSLQRASIVQGRVTDTSGTPIAGAAIGMTVDNLSYVGVADANRNYSYISGDLSEH
jgi:hypothetical protein